MIGSLVKYSVKKRNIYFPTLPNYDRFDGRFGLVTNYTLKKNGDEHVRVQWIGSSKHMVSDFNLLNFEIVSVA